MTIRTSLGPLLVGDGLEVAVMGVLNVSPESFYRGSVVGGQDRLLLAAGAMVAQGAAIVDVGARSTAPYGQAPVSADEEAERLAGAVALVAGKLGVPVSADTSRGVPARAALEAGACVVNDVGGLGDPALVAAVAAAGASVIVGASGSQGPERADPVGRVLGLLHDSLCRAEAAGIPAGRVAVDPGIGFFRDGGRPWHEWDCAVLAGLGRLRETGRAICVGVSRKSFIGAVAGAGAPAQRLPGSLAAAAAAVLAGAHVVRAHDVAETVQAVRVAGAIHRAGA